MAQFNNLIVNGDSTFEQGFMGSLIHTSFSPYEIANGTLGDLGYYTTKGESMQLLELINIVRFSNGCAGSFNLSTAYTLNNVTISTGWYNFIWLPDVGYNINKYGTLILCGMTLDGFSVVRYANQAIASVHKWY